MTAADASLAVFAPSPVLTVTIERDADGDPELHVHAGGQGVWIARMAASLGGHVTLCAALGGETGRVLSGLLADERIQLSASNSAGHNGAYVHDRRSGARRSIVEIPGATLSRHELDDLYGKTVLAALESGALVLTGPQDAEVIGGEVYERLSRDARQNGVPVVADLTGQPLAGALAGGISLLKMSDEELRSEGLLGDGEPGEILEGIAELHARGADAVMLSRGEAGALAFVDDRWFEVVGPRLTPADPSGTGDSMTAAAALAVARGLPAIESLRLAAAAGTLNASRHGLGTGSRAEVERLVDHVEIRPLAHALAAGATPLRAEG